MIEIPPKPQLVFRELPLFPAIQRLKERDQWLAWEYQLKRGADGQMKWTKPPLDAKSGRKGSSTGSTTWASYATAAAFARKRGETGVGYALSPDDGLTGIDLDHCRDPKTGELEHWAAEVVALAETYCEVSPSGAGVRMFVDGKVAGAASYVPAGVEIYPGGRYLTLTGQHIPGTPTDIRPAPKTIAALEKRVADIKPEPEPAYQPKPNGIGGRASRPNGGAAPNGSDYFRNVNSASLQNLDCWFPAIFPSARRAAGTNGWRVSSRDLGRQLQEDLSATPQGIVDFGEHDMGDPRSGKRSPIDIVILFGGGVATESVSAAEWLCGRLGRDPADLGWNPRTKFSGGSSQPKTRTASGEVLPPGGPLTHDGVALQFAEMAEGRMRYCHSTGAWFIWDSVYWRQDRTDEALQFARNLARDLSRAVSNTDMKEARKVGFASSVEKFARGDHRLAVEINAWDQNPMLLGTPGGTVELTTGDLRDPDPADGITKIAAVAPSETADCPLWLEFLRFASYDNADLVRFLRQWLGYNLTGDTREHALVFAYGDGGNGKGVFLNTIAGILADYVKTAAMDTFVASQHDKHPTDLADLRGARVVVASETEEGRAWAEQKLKTMTGGDTIKARFMREDFFEYKPAFKLTIIGNHKPVLKNVDEAARRRFNLLPFTRKPDKPDRQLEVKLRAEWPGILRWMIDGCLDWQINGLVRPDVVLAATAEYFSDQDVFKQWFESECHFEKGNRYVNEPTAKLFEAWRKYAFDSGEEGGTIKAFGTRLERLGPVRKVVGGKRSMIFVELNETRRNREQASGMTDDRF